MFCPLDEFVQFQGEKYMYSTMQREEFQKNLRAVLKPHVCIYVASSKPPFSPLLMV